MLFRSLRVVGQHRVEHCAPRVAVHVPARRNRSRFIPTSLCRNRFVRGSASARLGFSGRPDLTSDRPAPSLDDRGLCDHRGHGRTPVLRDSSSDIFEHLFSGQADHARRRRYQRGIVSSPCEKRWTDLGSRSETAASRPRDGDIKSLFTAIGI